MRIKVDEDLPTAAVQMLQDSGYDATSVLNHGIGGAKDPELWEAVQAEHRFLVTADKGFANIRVYAPGTHAGVLLLRPDQAGIDPIIELLHKVLERYSLEALASTVTGVTPRSVRVRRD